MKKIYLSAALCIFALAQSQQRPSDQQMAPILAKMKLVSNPAAAFPANFFTAEEERLITDYYRPDDRNLHTSSTAKENTAYVLDARNAARDFGTFPINGPYVIDVKGSVPAARAIYADDFDESGVLYALDNTARKLVIVNPSDAAITEVATITGIPTTETLSGLAFNYKDNSFYALGIATAGTNLYKIDKRTAAATLIGTTPGISGIWLVIDNGGTAYTADITADNLHRVDLATGVGTLIGPLGINIQFAQEADVDTATDTIYMAAYLGGGAGGIYTVNKTTGTATLVGSTTANNAEYTMFSIDNPAPLGVNDAASKNSLSIYPNPVGDVLNIVSKGKVSAVEIYNTAGQLLLSKSENVLNVSKLSPGVYVVQLTIDGKKQAVKFVKK